MPLPTSRSSAGESFPSWTTASCLGRCDGRRPGGGPGGAGELRGRHPQVSDDRTLIRYLMRHWHTTPFEMAELKLLVRVPMDCWRQWIRHRTASVNETSTRYSIAIDAAQRTAAGGWRLQAAANRQGSEGLLDPAAGAALSAAEAEVQQQARAVYRIGWPRAWPANRPARTCPSPPTPRPIGKSTCTICCTSCDFA